MIILYSFIFLIASCHIDENFKNYINHCEGPYDITDEDDADYGVAWKPLNTSDPYSSRRRRRDATWVVKDTGVDRIYHSRGKRAVGGAKVGGAYAAMATGRNKQLRRRKQFAGSANAGKPVYYVSPNALLSDGTVISCKDRWEHYTGDELRGFPVPGRVVTYSGGGYVANLGYNEETSWTVLADLHSHNWLDKQTRSVFTEFTVYNGNINLFATAFLYLETLPTGGAFPWADFKIFNGYRYSAKDGLQSMWAEFVFIAFIIYFTVREFRKFLKQKKEYFKGFFNWVEVILVPLYIAMFGLIIIRWFTTAANIKTFKQNPKDFVSFQYSAAADTALMSVIGIVAFLLNIKFLRLLQFAKLFFVTGQVIKAFMHPLMMFMVPFTLYFLLFAWVAHLGFGSQNEAYMSVTRTIVTQFLHVLGAIDYEGIRQSNPIFGPMYFLAYTIYMMFIAFNMFMAIICEAIDEDYDEEFEKQAGDIQVVEYLTKRLREIIGINTDEDLVRVDGEDESDHEEKYKRTDQLVSEFELCISRIEQLVNKECSHGDEDIVDIDGEKNEKEDEKEDENESNDNNNDDQVDNNDCEKDSDCVFTSMEEIRI